MLAGLMLGANQTRAGAYMSWPGSIAYWIVISLATWWLLAAATAVLRRILRPWEPAEWLVLLGGALAGSAAARPVIYMLSERFRPLMHEPVLREMRPWQFDVDFLGYYLVNWSLIVAMWIAASLFANRWRQREMKSALQVSGAAAPAVPAPHLQGLMLRLPPALGRDVLAVKAEDHYVRVYTRLGNALIFGSLSDAIRDLEQSGVNGLRTHRSWWVASNAIAGHSHRGRHVMLDLANGVEVPVSLTYRQSACASGLLPT